MMSFANNNFNNSNFPNWNNPSELNIKRYEIHTIKVDKLFNLKIHLATTKHIKYRVKIYETWYTQENVIMYKRVPGQHPLRNNGHPLKQR